MPFISMTFIDSFVRRVQVYCAANSNAVYSRLTYFLHRYRWRYTARKEQSDRAPEAIIWCELKSLNRMNHRVIIEDTRTKVYTGNDAYEPARLPELWLQFNATVDDVLFCIAYECAIEWVSGQECGTVWEKERKRKREQEGKRDCKSGRQV